MSELLLKNGKTVENKKIDILIKDGIIAQIAPRILNDSEAEVFDLDGKYISAGWIDSHVHCFEKMKLYYDFPDEIGVKKGVTSVIDAGSAGAENISEFYEISRKCRTNVFALMNISKYGIVEQDELADLSKINEELNMKTLNQFPDFLLGIKARMSRSVVGENNVIPLEMAKALQRKMDGIPLMVHIGSAPPKLIDILNLLDKGDIVTHCFNGKLNGIMDSEGRVHDFVWDAYRRGIIFDIGHGTDSFNFKVARRAKREGLLCKTVSTDIYHRNRESGPVYDLATTLEKILSLGFSLSEVITMVTQNPAEIFKLDHKGRLEVGMDADFTVFSLENRPKELVDSNGNREVVTQQIIPQFAIIGGEVNSVQEAK